MRRQNRAKISVVIGNPPYNANQQNENDNNKNRTYPHIDELIKQTYVKQSSAQLNVNQYDMYTRFFRWASGRVARVSVETVRITEQMKAVKRGAASGC